MMKGDALMNKSRLVWIGLIVLSVWAATVYAHPRHGMGAMGPGRMMGDMSGMLLPLVLRGVDLTDEQEKRVHEIMQAHRATFRTLFRELQATQGEMADKLLAPGEVQAEDLTTHLQRAAQLREQLMQEGLKVALEVRGVLTPEQLTKASELKERMRALHSEMRGLFKETR
jgi:Spy/CpxP family protein refolding chaperone